MAKTVKPAAKKAAPAKGALPEIKQPETPGAGTDKEPVITPDATPEVQPDEIPEIQPDAIPEEQPDAETNNAEAEFDAEILEYLSNYVAAYPNETHFHFAEDMQVFLSANKREAQAHAKSINSELITYFVK